MIRYSAEAEADIRRLHNWLFTRHRPAALRFLEALEEAENAIGAAAHSFPQNDDRMSRRYIFRFGRSCYVMHYLQDGDDVVVVRLWHGREERP